MPAYFPVDDGVQEAEYNGVEVEVKKIICMTAMLMSPDDMVSGIETALEVALMLIMVGDMFMPAMAEPVGIALVLMLMESMVEGNDFWLRSTKLSGLTTALDFSGFRKER